VRKIQIRSDQEGTRGKIETATESGGVLKTEIVRGVCRMTGEGHDVIGAMLQKTEGITIVRNIIVEPRKVRKKTATTTITVIRDDVATMTTTQRGARDIETRDVGNTKMRVEQRTT